jgi:hypothetical protein
MLGKVMLHKVREEESSMPEHCKVRYFWNKYVDLMLLLALMPQTKIRDARWVVREPINKLNFCGFMCNNS